MQRVGADPSLLFDCLVAVTEACTNALIHGRTRSRDERPPLLAWSIDQGKAHFHIEDYSTEGWSRARHPSRTPGATQVEDLQAGGLGLGIMRDLMDEVDIEAGVAGTKVYLAKTLDSGCRTNASR